MTSPLDTLAPRLREVSISAPSARTGTIYLLLDGDAVVYVGQTTSVEQRVWMHRTGTKQTPPKVFTRALCFDVPLEDLGAFEGALIRRFNPKYCASSPCAEERDAEVLASVGLEPDSAMRDAFKARLKELWREVHRARRVREWASRRRRRGQLSAVLWRTAIQHVARLPS